MKIITIALLFQFLLSCWPKVNIITSRWYNNGLNIETAVHVWNTTCKSILLYGCNNMYINKTCLARLDKLQAKLIKTVVGINLRYHSSPLLEALKFLRYP